MNVLAKSSESGRWDSHGIAIVRRHFIGVGDHISQKLLLIILAIPGFMIAVSLFLAAAQRAFPKIGRHEGVRWAEFQSNTTSLFNILKFGGNDSWGPMLDARRWLALHPGGDVYQGLFFAGRKDFQVKIGERRVQSRAHPSLRTPSGGPIYLRIDPEKCVALKP